MHTDKHRFFKIFPVHAEVLAKTGAGALEIINKRPPEAALIDLTLKDISSCEGG